MKIKILTFITSDDNYGQVLQAFALQRYLRDLGHNVEVCHTNAFTGVIKHSIFVRFIRRVNNLTPAKIRNKFRWQNIYSAIKARERRVRRAINTRILKREKYLKRVSDILELQKRHAQRRAFLDCKRDFSGFKKKFIALHCDKLQDFAGFCDEYEADCYIIGSDQVWNVWENKALDFYTLTFLPPNHKSRKIAYAASFGRENFYAKEESAHFKKALSKFNAISVREACNIETLRNIGLKSECVPDPSQLLEKGDYEMLINLGIQNGEIDNAKSDGKVRAESIFVYMLGNETIINKDEMMAMLADFELDSANRVKNAPDSAKGGIIYANANVDFSCLMDYETNFAPTPQEWLACVGECRAVITNSFHGCAFALLMNTPFVALKLGGWAEGMNTRFYQLFEHFGVQNQLVDNLADLKAQLNAPIDWEQINMALKEWRGVGVEFLERNLG